MLQDLSKIYFSEGLKKLQQRKISSSLSCFKTALLFDDNNFQAMNIMGLCLYLQGLFKEAEHLWLKSIAVNVSTENIANSYLSSLKASDFKLFCKLYNEALKLAKDGYYKQAYKILSNEVFNNCDIIPVFNLKGLCMLALGKQTYAVSFWKQSLALNIEDYTAINYISNSFERKEKSTFHTLLNKIFRQ